MGSCLVHMQVLRMPCNVQHYWELGINTRFSLPHWSLEASVWDPTPRCHFAVARQGRQYKAYYGPLSLLCDCNLTLRGGRGAGGVGGGEGRGVWHHKARAHWHNLMLQVRPQAMASVCKQDNTGLTLATSVSSSCSLDSWACLGWTLPLGGSGPTRLGPV